MPQVEAAFLKIVGSPVPTYTPHQPTTDLPAGLPLTLTPSTSPGSEAEPLAIMISGDGGWTSFDQSLAQALAVRGIPSVGIDAQRYFWNAKTPAETTELVRKLVDHYARVWHRSTFVLVGYSFGAGVVPFVANRLPLLFTRQLRGVIMLSPNTDADFEIHLLDMLSLGPDKPYNVLAEISKCKTGKLLCVFGKDETDADIPQFELGGARVLTIPGGHHYDNNFTLLASLIGQVYR